MHFRSIWEHLRALLGPTWPYLEETMSQTAVNAPLPCPAYLAGCSGAGPLQGRLAAFCILPFGACHLLHMASRMRLGLFEISQVLLDLQHQLQILRKILIKAIFSISSSPNHNHGLIDGLTAPHKVSMKSCEQHYGVVDVHHITIKHSSNTEDTLCIHAPSSVVRHTQSGVSSEETWNILTCTIQLHQGCKKRVYEIVCCCKLKFV